MNKNNILVGVAISFLVVAALVMTGFYVIERSSFVGVSQVLDNCMDSLEEQRDSNVLVAGSLASCQDKVGELEGIKVELEEVKNKLLTCTARPEACRYVATPENFVDVEENKRLTADKFSTLQDHACYHLDFGIEEMRDQWWEEESYRTNSLRVAKLPPSPIGCSRVDDECWQDILYEVIVQYDVFTEVKARLLYDIREDKVYCTWHPEELDFSAIYDKLRPEQLTPRSYG